MTVHIEMQTEPFGPFTELDVEQLAISNMKLQIAYEHAARLSFSVAEPQHTRPIPYGAFLRVWIEGETVRGAAQSATNPLFEGFVEPIQPADANRVDYECFDPTFRCNKQVNLFNAPWEPGDPFELLWPQPTLGALPRLVYNCKNEADEDYAHSVGNDGTVANILAGILEYSYHPLVWRNAAPGDGTVEAAELPFVSADLEPFDFKPQQKLVFQSEGIRSCVERVRQFEPRMRLIFEPGTRLWRFVKIDSSSVVTLRLNDPEVPFPVLSLNMNSSIENCHTAMRVYGPETNTLEEFRWTKATEADPSPVNTLAPLGDPIELETWGDSSGFTTEQTWQRWQIVPAIKRRGAQMLPQWITIPMNAYNFMPCRRPVLQISYDRGTTWTTAENVWFDWLNGIATFQGTAPYYRHPTARPGSTQRTYAPTAVRLIWAPYAAPLMVRVPEEGYEGTAYTVAGLEQELEEYSEFLATGKEWGTPVTTEARREQFRKYARSVLDERKDIVWGGGLTLDGLDFQWAGLNRRVSFTSSDGAGGTSAIGWEDINAIVTDVEYDISQRLTTLTFSSDWLELLGLDPAELRERLKIKALEQVTLYQGRTLFFGLFKTYKGYSVQQVVGVRDNYRIAYLDQETGLEQ
ncbi:hypothetical protein Plim_2112 [Planctopirus limnophila DSM 3776]|uniref:Uncharacterized protein n=1 Tax=Planctopirus limnophila (strain ATCC 43296 / DSM 3776 / IFAM 1008 / Mu 290) TaxID=521674 RepID=D5SMN4_PLAL2|nr:hypothetical protein [Planctopirus limnophila]ADG67939.1 hypothetical protein Plim_2112 [Planctopirus limnophila DSM 3776]